MRFARTAAVAAALLALPLQAWAAPKEGDIAPEIVVSEQVQGEKFTSLKALRGRVVIIDFYGLW